MKWGKFFVGLTLLVLVTGCVWMACAPPTPQVIEKYPGAGDSERLVKGTIDRTEMVCGYVWDPAFGEVAIDCVAK